MIQFPKDLNDAILLSSFDYTKFKQFNEQDKDFLIINKRIEQEENPIFNCVMNLNKDEYQEFEYFYSNDLKLGIKDFNIFVLKDDKLVEINSYIFGNVSISYFDNRVKVSFILKENYQLL